jgi:hypothetical protein
MFDSVKQSGGKTIDALLMDTGGVASVVKDNNTWPDLSATLQKIFLPSQQRDQPAPVQLLGKNNLERLVDFLEKFMEGNGQWEYIERQEWYRSGAHAIGIDVNYYPDRSGFTTFIAFHKDTAGDNIFVNLVFDNQTEIEATEWYVDIAEPSKKRKAWQDKLLPETYRKELASARDKFRSSLGGKQPEVAGGVSTYLYTFVSWVDDLVWHSTPNGNKRTEYSAEAAERGYARLQATVNNGFQYLDSQLGVTVLGAELLGTMAEVPGPNLAVWLKKNDLQMQDLGVETSKQAWRDLYGGIDGKDLFVQDAKVRALADWRVTGRYSDANSKDPSLPGSETIKEPPVRLSRLRRVNSNENIQKDLAKAREASKGKPRAFIRTWVRILRSDDPLVQRLDKD